MIVSYGPFHPALEEAFVSRIRELIASGEIPVCVVVPSRRMASRLERLLGMEEKIALLNIHFHTFYSLAWSIAREEEPLNGVFISEPLFFNRLVDSLAETQMPDSLWPRKSKRPKSLSESLRSSLRDLIDANLIFEDLNAYWDEACQFKGGEVLEPLCRFAQAYREKLAELGVFSMAELVRFSAQKSKDSSFLKQFREIIYYGFYDLTGLQLDFFENVTKSHPSRLFFPYIKSHPAFAFAKDFFEQKLAAHELRELEVGFDREPLGPVLKNLFSPAEKKVSLSQAIRFVSASGLEDEIWFSAKEIWRLVEEEKIGFDEIGLVCRSLEGARSSIERIFEENKIPLDMKAQEPLLRHPLAKTLFNFLSLGRRDFPAYSVEEVASSPYFNSESLESLNWKWSVRRITRDLKLSGGWLQWEGRLGEIISKKADIPENFPLEPAKELWNFLLLWREVLNKNPGSWSGFAKASSDLIERFFKLPESPSAQEKEALELFLNALKTLSLLDRISRPRDFADGLDALDEKLKRSSFETSSGIKGVRALDAMAARGESFRVLFVLGLNEGVFPRTISEDPILRDEARAFLRHPLGYWMRPKKEGYEEEKLLFYLLVSGAKEKIYCVYSRSDEEGREQVPSFYLYELARAANRSLGEEDVLRVPRNIEEKLNMFEPRYLSPDEMSLYASFRNQSAVSYLKALDLPQAEILDVGLKAALELNDYSSGGERDGMVRTPEDFLQKWKHNVSASGLELYAQCPFRFFAARILRLSEEEKNAKDEIPPKIIGLIYHDILKRFYSSLPVLVLEGKKSYEDFLNRAIEDSFSEYNSNKLGVYPLLWLSVKNNMSVHLRKFVEWDIHRLQERNMRPLEFEKEFRADIAQPSAYGLRGVFDRIDQSLDGKKFEIIDYKTSWRKGDPKKLVQEGSFFQLPFYFEILSQKYPESEIEGGLLYEIEGKSKDAVPSVYPYSFFDWQAQRESFFENVSRLLSSIARGYFPINPDDQDEYGHCGYCRFQNLCRKNHSPSKYRAKMFLENAFPEKQN